MVHGGRSPGPSQPPGSLLRPGPPVLIIEVLTLAADEAVLDLEDVRVVEYHLLEADGSPTEVFALLTTLLDPETAPAAELAELYHARWQIENAFSALKSQLKGDGVVLRSKTECASLSWPHLEGF